MQANFAQNRERELYVKIPKKGRSGSQEVSQIGFYQSILSFSYRRQKAIRSQIGQTFISCYYDSLSNKSSQVSNSVFIS